MRTKVSFLEFNKNESTAYPNLRDTLEAVLGGKFIALRAYIRKVKNSQTSDLTAHLKTLEQKEADSPGRSRCQQIIQLRAEINKTETKKIIQRIN